MAAKAKNKYTELTCILCNYPLTSYKTFLTDEAISLISEPTKINKKSNQTQNDISDHSRIAALEKDQVVATKCGHMFHVFCLRTYIKNGIEKKGTAFCPICTKPVTLARIWPVLIPPTGNQTTRFQKLSEMKEQNIRLRHDLQELRLKIDDNESKLKKIQNEITECIEDIHEKESSFERLAFPSEEDLEELKKIHEKRQLIVKVVTKHNADLLELLMQETNARISEVEIARKCSSSIQNVDMVSKKSQSEWPEDANNLLSGGDKPAANKSDSITSTISDCVNNNTNDIQRSKSKKPSSEKPPYDNPMESNSLAQHGDTVPQENPNPKIKKAPAHKGKRSDRSSGKKSTKSSVTSRSTEDGKLKKGKPRSKAVASNKSAKKPK